MDASWLAIGVAAVAAVPGVLAYVGTRSDRRTRDRGAVIEGYDHLVDDLQAELARRDAELSALRAEVAAKRAERAADAIDADRRPRPARRAPRSPAAGGDG